MKKNISQPFFNKVKIHYDTRVEEFSLSEGPHEGARLIMKEEASTEFSQIEVPKICENQWFIDHRDSSV